jgi:GNAT superfamily N-acetyltransferase
MERNIITYKNHEGDFYEKMGPFFANRKYAFEMGMWQFYTKDNAVWFVMYQKNVVIGFCSIIIEKTHLFFDNSYIVKEYRGKGYYSELFKVRYEYAKEMNKEIRLICDNESQIKRYTNYGFEHYGFRGRYNKFRYAKKNV